MLILPPLWWMGFAQSLPWPPPADLARVQIIVNTQRLARRVSDLFAAKENILHPKLHVLNDLSGLAPQIMLPAAPPALSSRFELLALVEKLLVQQPDLAARSALFDLTDSLAQLIEEMQDEGVGRCRPKRVKRERSIRALAAHPCFFNHRSRVSCRAGRAS